MAAVTWRKLTLWGFGRFAGEATLELGDGVNVLVADNEQGKSTMARGLAAVLFGLQTAASPAVIGTARFKNWDGPARFEGALEFDRDGERFRIARNFATHRVSLSRHGPRGWVEEVGGEHNPRAQRPNAAYERRLGELIGITTRELFEATFGVTQPLPAAEQVASGVAWVLSGAGAGYLAARERLTEAVKALTRRTGPGELDVTPRDGRIDQERERLEARAGELRQVIAAARGTGDARVDAEHRLVELDEVLAAAQADLRQKQDVLAAWTEWRNLRDAYNRALEAQLDAARAVRAAEDQKRRLEMDQQELAREFPDLAREGGEGGAGRARGAGGAAASAAVDWGRLGTNPSRALRLIEDHAAGAVKRWRAFAAAAADLDRCRDELSRRFAVLEAADPDTVDALRNYDGRRAQLEATLTMAGDAHGAASRRSDLTRARSRGRRLALAGLAGAVAGVLVWAMWRGGAPDLAQAALVVLAAVAAAALVWLVGGRARRSAAVADLDAALSAAREELAAFERVTAPAAAAFGAGLANAVREWEAERHRAAGLDARVTDYAQDELGTTPDAVAAAPVPAGPAWAELAGLAAVCGQSPSRAIELLGWLYGLDGRFWAASHAGAAAWEANQRQREHYRERRRAIDAGAAALLGLLEGQGVDDLDGLHKKATGASNQAASALSRWQEHVRAHPGLPAAAGPEPPDELEQRYQGLKAAVAARDAGVEGAKEAVLAAQREQARLEGASPLNVAAAEVELAEVEAARERLELEVEALALAFHEIGAAAEEYQAEHRDRLADLATARFGELCGVSGRQVAFGPDFAVTVRGSAGQPIEVAQLSQGAQDQLFIALRLAIADLITAGTRLPLIFDDPFLTCDPERLGRMRAALDRVAAARQVVLLTHRPGLAAWGRPVAIRAGA